MTTTAEQREGASERVWVERERLVAVRRSIEALSRRGMRLGTGPIRLRELGERDGEVELEVRGARPQIGGYRVVATLHHEGAETVVEGVPGEPVEASRWTLSRGVSTARCGAGATSPTC